MANFVLLEYSILLTLMFVFPFSFLSSLTLTTFFLSIFLSFFLSFFISLWLPHSSYLSPSVYLSLPLCPSLCLTQVRVDSMMKVAEIEEAEKQKMRNKYVLRYIFFRPYAPSSFLFTYYDWVSLSLYFIFSGAMHYSHRDFYHSPRTFPFYMFPSIYQPTESKETKSLLSTSSSM